MFPSFILFGKTISMYAVMTLIGLLSAGYFFCKNIKRNGHNDNQAIVFLLFVAIGILVGGNTMFAITNLDKFYLLGNATGFGDFFRILAALFGGSVFYGGLIGATIIAVIYIKVKKLPRNLYFDCLAFCAPLFHFFARIGCFLGGCCYGIESSFGFCATNNTITDIGNVSRFPVQLLESLINLLIFALIYFLYRKYKLTGQLFLLYLALYSVARFFIEFLRGDKIRGFIFGLSTSQFISVLILFALIITFTTKYIKSKKATN